MAPILTKVSYTPMSAPMLGISYLGMWVVDNITVSAMEMVVALTVLLGLEKNLEGYRNTSILCVFTR